MDLEEICMDFHFMELLGLITRGVRLPQSINRLAIFFKYVPYP